MKQPQNLLLLFLISISFFTCDSSSIEPANQTSGQEYYPFTIGHQTSYQVTKTIFKLNDATEIQTYQVKELIKETFQNQTGETAYKLIRYVRQNAFENWQADSVWSVRLADSRIIKTEQATPFVKLNLPLSQGKTWDGNLFNAEKPQDYLVEYLGSSQNIGGTDYPNTLGIIEKADSSLVSRNVRRVVYAENIGLVYQKSESLIYCNDPSINCFGLNIIERGEIIETVLFDWGQE